MQIVFTIIGWIVSLCFAASGVYYLLGGPVSAITPFAGAILFNPVVLKRLPWPKPYWLRILAALAVVILLAIVTSNVTARMHEAEAIDRALELLRAKDPKAMQHVLTYQNKIEAPEIEYYIAASVLDESFRVGSLADLNSIGTQRARELLIDSATKGYAPAQYLLCELELGGADIEEKGGNDVAGRAGVAWCQKGSAQGYGAATRKLADAYLNGIVEPKDAGRALSLLELAVSQGDKDAAAELAVQYGKGGAFPEDAGKAFTWTQRAAELGDAYSQYRIGLIYFQLYTLSIGLPAKIIDLPGSGVPSELFRLSTVERANRASKYLRASADQGDLAGEVGLARFLLVESDELAKSETSRDAPFARAVAMSTRDEARKWLAKADGRGDIDAMLLETVFAKSDDDAIMYFGRVTDKLKDLDSTASASKRSGELYRAAQAREAGAMANRKPAAAR